MALARAAPSGDATAGAAGGRARRPGRHSALCSGPREAELSTRGCARGRGGGDAGAAAREPGGGPGLQGRKAEEVVWPCCCPASWSTCSAALHAANGHWVLALPSAAALRQLTRAQVA